MAGTAVRTEGIYRAAPVLLVKIDQSSSAAWGNKEAQQGLRCTAIQGAEGHPIIDDGVGRRYVGDHLRRLWERYFGLAAKESILRGHLRNRILISQSASEKGCASGG